MLQKLPVNALRRAGTTMAVVAAVAAASTSLAPTASAATVGCPSTPSFDFTVPVPAGPPALVDFVDSFDGVQDIGVSILGSDHQYYTHAARFGADVDEIGPLGCLQGTGIDQPGTAVTPAVDQHFELHSDGTLWERDATFETLTDWTQIPGASSQSGVDVVASGDRTDIFYVSANATKEIMHQWKIGDVWSAAESLGGATNEVPSVTRGADGKIHVWVTGLNDKIYFNAGNTGAWGGWHSLSSGASEHTPAAAIGYGSTSREDVFVTGTNGFLYQATFTNLGSFTGFHRLVAVGTDARLAAASQGKGHMVVMWTSAGATSVTQYISGVTGGWLTPYTPTYLCADCVPAPAGSASSTSVSPKIVSQQAHTAFRSAPHN
jgi:hypothetical protein